MKFLNLILALLWISLIQISSRLTVYGPSELKKYFEFNSTISYLIFALDYKIIASYANFGTIPYG